MKIYYKIATYLLFINICLLLFSCKKFVEVDTPRTDIIGDVVFESDATAIAAATDMYYKMASVVGFAGGGPSSISLITALASDESINRLTFLADLQQINDNSINTTNSTVLTIWSDLYNTIYKANAILEGINKSTVLSEITKKQLEGEALFVRSFCLFYLANIWGPVPMPLTTDYATNRNLGRTIKNDIYIQIVSDLKKAKMLLPDNYTAYNNERIKPNAFAASALLARIYLYQNDWTGAETESSSIIENTSLYSIVPVTSVFLKNNAEAIWQIFPQGGNVYDRTSSRSYSQLRNGLLNAFEAGDERTSNWLISSFANKYKSGDNSYSEYSVVMRLAEQYLIRAEARAQLEKISEAKADLDVIRIRAGLTGTSSSDKASLLESIERERRVELFTEWGHRWFDLIRWEKADGIMQSIKPGWQSTDTLFPIPHEQIIRDLSMTQNPGY